MKHVLLTLLTILCLSTISYSTNFLISADSTVTIYRVQIASRPAQDSAIAIQQQVSEWEVPSVAIQSTLNGWRVYAGPWPTKSEASTTLKQVQSLGFADALITTKEISYQEALNWNLPLNTTHYRQILAIASQQPTVALDSLYTQGINSWNQSDANDTSRLYQAIGSFAQIISKYPNSSQAIDSRYNIGQIYASLYSKTRRKDMLDEPTRKKFLESAVDVLSEHISKNPAATISAQAQKQIADCLHVLSNYRPDKLPKCAEAYKKVFTNYPDSSYAPDAHLQYAGVFFEQAYNGTFSWATIRILLNEVLTLYPSAPRKVKSRALAMITEAYLFDRNPSMVLVSAQSTLQIYSDITEDVALSHQLMGQAYLHLHRNTAAESEFTSLLSTYQGPNNYDPSEWTLNGFSQLSAHDPLVSLCRQATYYFLALYYQQSGDSTKFHDICQQAITEYPQANVTSPMKALRKISPISADTNTLHLVEYPMILPSLTFALKGDNHE